jgi:hypothetical protein
MPAALWCSVDLPDGSPCPELAIVSSYCARHSAVADRDFQVFQALHDHFQQDLREFWQRSNFYLVVDGLLVSAFATAHLHALQIVLSCAGLVISLFWLLVARAASPGWRHGALRSADSTGSSIGSSRSASSRVGCRDGPGSARPG